MLPEERDHLPKYQEKHRGGGGRWLEWEADRGGQETEGWVRKLCLWNKPSVGTEEWRTSVQI